MARLLSGLALVSMCIARSIQFIVLLGVVAVAVVVVVGGGARSGVWLVPAFALLAFLSVAIALFVLTARGMF